MISLKPGVRLSDLAPQVVLAHTVVWAQWLALGWSQVDVTSGSDSQHTDTPRPSGHYGGRALDYRTHDKWLLEPEREAKLLGLQANLRYALGPDFLILMEKIGTPNEHLHVEYLPRKFL